MALDFFIVGRSQQIDERFEEAGIDNRGLVERVDRDVTDTCDSG